MSYHNIPSSATQSTTNAQGKTAPAGYHYMPDGTLMSDIEHTRLYGQRNVITSFDLDFSNIPTNGTTKYFSVHGNGGATFSLEVKNEDNYYYNFNTNLFQVAKSKLKLFIIFEPYKLA